MAEKRTILLVDDTPGNLALLNGLLKEEYKTKIATSGEKALKIALSDQPPDLVLLDIMMPEMDGYEVCQRLKADERTREIPIIFISAMTETLDKVKAFSVGGVDYITKPFQFEEVMIRVKTHLSLASLRQQLEEVNEELSRTNKTLEQRVQERTAALVELNHSCERFVPKELLDFLGVESIRAARLGDVVNKEMAIMFSDIRSYTSLSEQMTPQESFSFVNDYLGAVSPLVREHRGLVIKYLGDGFMAVFPEGVADAMRAGSAILSRVESFNQARKLRAQKEIQIGIGVHYGPMMVGLLGTAERMQGDVMSDHVNLASRLENLTKDYGASFLLSGEAVREVSDRSQFCLRYIGQTKVRGKQSWVSLFENFDADPQDVKDLKASSQETFEEGMHCFESKRFPEASVAFNKVLKQHPQDKAARLYLELAARFMVEGPPADWVDQTS